jgi:hypothetical protein
MFHIIEFVKDTKKGKILSWEYDIENGWKQRPNINFPPIIGFGGNINIANAAKKINKLFINGNSLPLMNSDIQDQIPEIEYVIPTHLIALNKKLKEQYKIIPKPEYPLEPNLFTAYLK